jgi:hypothetical protein
MNNQLLCLDRIQQSTPIRQLIPINTELYNPGTWIIKGDSPAEIILATAILMGSISGLLNVLTASKQR